jgi:hypothetical protein
MRRGTRQYASPERARLGLFKSPLRLGWLTTEEFALRAVPVATAVSRGRSFSLSGTGVAFQKPLPRSASAPRLRARRQGKMASLRPGCAGCLPLAVGEVLANPSLESGPSEAGRLGPGCASRTILAARAKATHLSRLAQLER